jgi:hypothetical protein
VLSMGLVHRIRLSPIIAPLGLAHKKRLDPVRVGL